MIKKYLSCVAATLSMVACTSTDLIEESLESGTAICFNTNVTREIGRASCRERV